VYGFERHAGYPTTAHLAALEVHGASPVHRKTFGPVKRILIKTYADRRT
jgi:ribonuclease HII